MKILLVSPSRRPERKTAKGQMMPQLALYILAGMTPPEYEVHIVEEEVDTVNLDEPCDLVAISCMTATAPRAYYLATEFRKRGKKIIMGGVHPTVMPDEALSYADSIVVGEAEGVWAEVLEDFKAGNLKTRYHKSEPDLDKYIEFKELNSQKKGLIDFSFTPVMTTRGCPYSCDFCSVKDIFGKKIRSSPVENAVRAIKDSHAKRFMFLDDNIIGKPEYAKSLFKAVAELGIEWIGQASISFVHDTELMKLAKKSGCLALFFGMETVSETQLKQMSKSIKSIDKIEEAIKKVKDTGIHFHGSFVFGFDTDTTATFPETLEFMQRNKIPTASFNILTPYPGTEVFNRLKKEGRLLTEDWLYYDHTTVVFTPKNMSPFELQTGRDWVEREFTRIPNLLHRYTDHASRFMHPLLFWYINLSARGKVRRKDDKLDLLEKMFGDKMHLALAPK